jgi:DNA-directed RNA polymerase specialized sigma24 family protein
MLGSFEEAEDLVRETFLRRLAGARAAQPSWRRAMW